jgi:hypothetical protein
MSAALVLIPPGTGLLDFALGALIALALVWLLSLWMGRI